MTNKGIEKTEKAGLTMRYRGEDKAFLMYGGQDRKALFGWMYTHKTTHTL